MEWFRANQIDAVELYVAQENEGAKRFWRRRGYDGVEEVMALQPRLKK
jgi:ribosomal protein S18 acetylase RimI-like enzyme